MQQDFHNESNTDTIKKTNEKEKKVIKTVVGTQKYYQ